jgi:CheY-like chemotaxis protein
MSRIESGKMILRSEAFSFKSMIDQINVMVMTQCSDKGLRYESRVIGDVSDSYIGDDMKLKQVLINILSNAIKFTEAPGSVMMTVERTAVFEGKSTLKFVIKDTGIGMDTAFIPKVFDTFAQEYSGRTNKYGSTGLGMAITKNIVETMNGSILVESEKGLGTEVTVVVTLDNCESEHAADKNSREAVGVKKRADINGRNILLAEDVMINAEIMKEMLGIKGLKIDHAENGKLALEMFSGSDINHYAAILMDVRMPEMDGLEAAERIRSLDREDAGTVPIIALTANAFDEDVQRSLQAGMNAHLIKPVDPERLYKTLEELISEEEPL